MCRAGPASRPAPRPGTAMHRQRSQPPPPPLPSATLRPQGLLPDQHRGLVQQCIGGANPRYQEQRLLENKPLMVVGTPGRIAELVRGAVLRLHEVRCASGVWQVWGGVTRGVKCVGCVWGCTRCGVCGGTARGVGCVDVFRGWTRCGVCGVRCGAARGVRWRKGEMEAARGVCVCGGAA
eukprot:362781-Chlamydomonas_euryale.AAC.4